MSHATQTTAVSAAVPTNQSPPDELLGGETQLDTSMKVTTGGRADHGEEQDPDEGHARFSRLLGADDRLPGK